MPIPYGKRITWKGKDRLHDRINTLSIVNAALVIATSAILKGRTELREGGGVKFSCKQVDASVGIPVRGALENALAEKYPDGIEIDISPREPTHLLLDAWAAGLQASPKSRGLQTIVPKLITPVFVEFYEAYKQWVYNHFGSLDRATPAWQFARIIRNSISHDGKVLISDATAKPATWHGLTYGPADNGRVTIGGDLSSGDILILILEMSDELDAAGCTI
jgi:hypothetical protein